MSKAEEKYEKRLRNLGTGDLVSPYKGKRVPTMHLCGCGTTFLSSPERILKVGKVQCLRCFYLENKKVSEREDGLRGLTKAFPDIKCLKFSAKKSKFRCSVGHTWTDRVSKVEVEGCPQCLKDLEKECRTGAGWLKHVRLPSLTILKVLGAESKVHCDACGFTWVYGNLALTKMVACPSCERKDRSERYLKTVKDGSVSVKDPVKIGHGYFWPCLEKKTKIIEVVNVEDIGSEWAKLLKGKTTLKGKLECLALVKGATIPFPKKWETGSAAEVVKTVMKKTNERLRILSLDPGTSNFAWTVIEVSRPFKVQVLATGMIVNTLKCLTHESKSNLDKFKYEVRAIKEQFGVDHLILERFMTRGLKGVTIELVNAMIGCLLSEWEGTDGSIRAITAAQWKNEWNKHGDLKEFYEKVDCTVHQADALGIGMYGAATWFDEQPFSTIKELEKQLIEDIRKVNMEKQCHKN